jgi:hypothetical protein
MCDLIVVCRSVQDNTLSFRVDDANAKGGVVLSFRFSTPLEAQQGLRFASVSCDRFWPNNICIFPCCVPVRFAQRKRSCVGESRSRNRICRHRRRTSARRLRPRRRRWRHRRRRHHHRRRSSRYRRAARRCCSAAARRRSRSRRASSSSAAASHPRSRRRRRRQVRRVSFARSWLVMMIDVVFGPTVDRKQRRCCYRRASCSRRQSRRRPPSRRAASRPATSSTR